MRWSGPEQHRKPFQKSAGPVKPPRQVPPYLPTSRSGLITTGSCPTRSATGGSLPALTSSASCGASLRLLGSFAASVTTSGPSSLPMNVLLPAFCASAPAAMTPLSAPIASVSVSRDRSVRFHGIRLSSVMRVPLSRCAASCRLSLGSNHLHVRAHLPRWLVEVGPDYRDIPPASPGSSWDAFPVATGPAKEGSATTSTTRPSSAGPSIAGNRRSPTCCEGAARRHDRLSRRRAAFRPDRGGPECEYRSRHGDGGAPERQRTRPRPVPRRHGIVEALDPQHRAARHALHRARARPSVVRRLGARRARDDRRRVPRPRARSVPRDVPGRRTAAVCGVLLRRGHRREPCAAAGPAGDASVPGLARWLPRATLWGPADPELPGGGR